MSELHVIRDGECLSSIAFERGFFYETLWNHERNSGLHEQGRTPHILKPGDEVFIPEKRVEWRSCATGKQHVFRRKGVPEFLHLRFADGGNPRTDVPYVLTIDGQAVEGRTDAKGELRHALVPTAAVAVLVLRPPDAREERYELRLRRLLPVSETAGVQARLRNLGVYEGEVHGTLDEATKRSVAAFQSSAGLDPTGEADDATCKAIVAAHGT